MARFVFAWRLESTRNYHQTKRNHTVSNFKIDAEWSVGCLCMQSTPDILEIRRISKGKEILVSGLFRLLRDAECVLERKFVQLIEAGSTTTLVELEYSNSSNSDRTTYALTGILTIPAYLSHTEYIKGSQIESLVNLSTEFERLLDPKATSFSDVKFNCGTDSFPVHKNILSARSPVFAAMFTTEMKENRNNIVDITDISPNILRTMLTYIYTGKIEELAYQFAGELLFAADKYQLLDLKRLCSIYLRSCMSTKTALNILVLGYLHDQELKVYAMDFICNTCEELGVMEKTEEWKTVCQKSPDLAIDVLSRLVKSKEKDCEVKEVTKKWRVMERFYSLLGFI